MIFAEYGEETYAIQGRSLVTGIAVTLPRFVMRLAKEQTLEVSV
jgi:hypothetical protein